MSYKRITVEEVREAVEKKCLQLIQGAWESAYDPRQCCALRAVCIYRTDRLDWIGSVYTTLEVPPEYVAGFTGAYDGMPDLANAHYLTPSERAAYYEGRQDGDNVRRELLPNG